MVKEIFEWDDKFATQIVNIDQEHKMLVDIINKIGNKLTDKSISLIDLDPIFKELFAYAQYHFTNEEAFSAENGVDERHREDHHKAHETFVTRVTDLYDKLTLENFKEKGKELLDFLVNWLTFHILGMDKILAAQISLIQSGMKPEEAYETAMNSKEQNQINVLVRSFNNAFESLMQYNKELLALKENLEKEIAARTAELKEANKQLEKFAMYDALTGLSNRRKMADDIQKLIEFYHNSGEIFSVIMIDLDDFKIINDTYGHDMGDKTLCEVSNVIKDCIRPEDIACRLGGDEFMVICENTSLDGAISLSDKIKNNIQKISIPIPSSKGMIVETAISVGVASWNKNMCDISDILKAADIALYNAKRGGKGLVCHI